MNATNNGMSCQTRCWALAGGGGLLIFLLLLLVGFAVIGALLLAIVIAAALGLLLQNIRCAPDAETGAASATDSQARTVAASAPSATPAPDPAPAGAPEAAERREDAPAEERKAPPPAPGAAVADADSETGPLVKPTKELPGQKDLAERKGTWRYEGDGSVTDAGAKPATLDAPRPGGADDLKRIKGVGPKLEDMLHRLGFFHFDQIAAWTDEEAAWVDANLDGFNGRVTRDDWVAQARALAAGEDPTANKGAGSGAT
ncbi:endonuclease [Roseivivax sediminis]|uniref:Predicted 5' DNA nuclease, flap endonuclease-1-like, helix-3-turn-helix (H3TH) domain n=1 Tax=Roseivivax sediminis TaxID=936889 RepID=A0A1I1VFG0_9RHOB|nr:endonuclease [Roseivivax sediminis]SFD81802.1 Predicted 5' DNA nuclease, flap endonuclease-1-like, helix-3-turn-helix (H3TH) domain [Roseivivax sediminis]